MNEIEEFLIDLQVLWARTGHKQIAAIDLPPAAHKELVAGLGKRLERPSHDDTAVWLQGPRGAFLVRVTDDKP